MSPKVNNLTIQKIDKHLHDRKRELYAELKRRIKEKKKLEQLVGQPFKIATPYSLMMQKKDIEHKRQRKLQRILDGNNDDYMGQDYSGNLVGTLMKRTMADKRLEIERKKTDVDEIEAFMRVNVRVTQKV